MVGSLLLSWIFFPMLGIAGLYTIPKAYSLDIYFPDRPKLVRNLRITAIPVGMLSSGIIEIFLEED